MRTKSLIERSAIPSFPPPEENTSPKTLRILEDKREVDSRQFFVLKTGTDMITIFRAVSQ